ncbi:MAG: RyR domain-containing protein [Gemmataceae bacterium]
MDYKPLPIGTPGIVLGPEVSELIELLAKNTHEVWARQRSDEGWKWGPARDDKKKEHPCLVPYEQLPESEKEYDRNTSIETLKVIIALGYRIEKAQPFGGKPN